MESDQALGLAPLGSASAEQPLGKMEAPASPLKLNMDASKASGTALDHLDALGDDAASIGSKQLKVAPAKLKHEGVMIGDEAASGGSTTLSSSNQKVLLDALLSKTSAHSARRDRLESWGGMSDLSATGFGVGTSDGRLGDAAAALAASALHYTGLIEDVTSAAAHPRTSSLGSHSSGDSKPGAIPSGISLVADRKMSVSEFSWFGEHSTGSDQIVPHIQAFVDAAMATVGDQLEDLAGAVEMAAFGTGDGESLSSDVVRTGMDSDASSTMSPLIGPVSDFSVQKRPRSMSTSSKTISVDYDAVASAVEAAQAATGSIDLSTIGCAMAPPPVPSIVLSTDIDANLDKKPAASARTDKEMEDLRKRAREAAGYAPPAEKGTPEPRPPLKKRPKQPTPDKAPSASAVSLPFPDLAESTPRVSNVSTAPRALVPPTPGAVPYPPLTVSSEPMSNPTFSRAANQKWDEMYECLIKYAEIKRAEGMKYLSGKEKETYEWDGNVPTTYKTPDGKALGRWVNNQRSAKAKGNMRRDREEKLESTGLRWSNTPTNSWQHMMDELLAYIDEKTKGGKKWDGNVPTNYSIKAKAPNDEEKNLGRWVNRQRSARTAGKLRADREKQLEDAGLKWAVLSTSSWDDMYEVLCDYVKGRKEEDPKNEWDGNVPANYKTNDDPPKALGRWINRQRSNYVKNKLKKEHIDKLSGLGLKWAVHDRTRYASYTEPCESTTFVSKAMKVVPSKPALVSDSNKTSPDSGKNSSETDTNAIDCSSSKKVGAVVSDSSSAAALSGNEKVKEMKVAAK
jgi:hypothetical protein